ncbi:MAG: type III pantothenate kinase [Bacteroidetes bacterium]|nr:MAG: type III pantothenate kinase [Bacteroidota bacterium]
MNLAIDIGNSFAKIGRFESGLLRDVISLPTYSLATGLMHYLEVQGQEVGYVGWVNVSGDIRLEELPVWKQHPAKGFFHIHPLADLPVRMGYHTPETLGADRLVGVIGARAAQAEGPVLVLDAGTALTYDLLTADNTYLGGGISPGIRMRFRALHEFTARLPLVEAEPAPPLVGHSTRSCILSGVIHGIRAEADGIIERYIQDYGSDLGVFLTGGDVPYFENHLKNKTFADTSLILKGIHYLVTHRFSL